MHRLLIHVITFSLGTMFHQQLKICHWWFYVDCESSAQFYKVNPELEDIVGRQDSTYGDSVDLEDSDYLFSPPIGDSAGGYNRRQFLRSRRFRPNNFRRIGNRAALLSDIRGTRQARFPRRRQLKAIPSSSFREDQNRKRISRQVESRRKKSDVTGKNIKNTSFEEFTFPVTFVRNCKHTNVSAKLLSVDDAICPGDPEGQCQLQPSNVLVKGHTFGPNQGSHR